MTDTLPARVRQRLTYLAPLEPAIYAVWAAAITLICACAFYSSMRLQTAYADLFRDSERAFEAATSGALGPWSAPLDDVFIHFDFARSAAQGHPFEWVPGNGYSSGSTSLLYPFVLATGYLLGFQGLELMHFAAIIACVSVFAVLLGLRRAFERLPVWTSYLLPLALLGVGALSWALFSGMEIAFFLALWLGAFLAWSALCDGITLSSSG